MKIFTYSIFFILIEIISSYVLLPFDIKDNSNIITNSNNEIDNIIYTNYLTEIEIGNPPQKVTTKISSNDYGLKLKEEENSNNNIITHYYNKKDSSSLKEIISEDPRYISPYLNLRIKESIIFPNNYNSNNFTLNLQYAKKLTKEEEKNWNKYYSREAMLIDSIIGDDEYESFLDKYDDDNKAFLVMGMRLNPDYNSYDNFIKSLKKNNITENNIWFINYFNDDKGELIIGNYPHEYYKDKYNENQLKIVNALNYQQEQIWQIQFKDTYFIKDKKNISIGLDINAQFMFDLNFIISNENYLNLLQENFFNKLEGKCQSNISENGYIYYICDKDVDIKKFPTLYLFHKIYNYTFELSYKDLFMEKGEKFLFLVLFDKNCKNMWKFGKILMKKYLFMFNIEDKVIGFYNTSVDNDNSWFKSFYIYIIFGILIILAGVGGFFVGKKIYNKIRKSRVNELEDNFDYSGQIN